MQRIKSSAFIKTFDAKSFDEYLATLSKSRFADTQSNIDDIAWVRHLGYKEINKLLSIVAGVFKSNKVVFGVSSNNYLEFHPKLVTFSVDIRDADVLLSIATDTLEKAVKNNDDNIDRYGRNFESNISSYGIGYFYDIDLDYVLDEARDDINDGAEDGILCIDFSFDAKNESIYVAVSNDGLSFNQQFHKHMKSFPDDWLADYYDIEDFYAKCDVLSDKLNVAGLKSAVAKLKADMDKYL